MKSNRMNFADICGRAFYRVAMTLMVGLVFLFPVLVSAAVVVRVVTSDGVPGGAVTLEARLEGDPSDPAVAGVQMDLVLNTTQLELEGQCSTDQSSCEDGTLCPGQGRCVPTCVASSGLTQHVLVAAYPDFQNVPVGHRRLRLPVNADDFPPAGLPAGRLLTCTFPVRDGASLGAFEITADLARFRLTDEASDAIPGTLVIEPGTIVSELPTVTPTSTETATERTPTTTPSETATFGTPTPDDVTATPTANPTDTPADETPTSTPSGVATPTSTPTLVPTSTSTIPQATVTAVPSTPSVTAVPTETVAPAASATPTSASPTATSTTGGTSGGRVKDNDGCTLVEVNMGPTVVWPWTLAVALLLTRRRGAS